MNKDYKTRTSPRARRGHRGSGFFWFVTGAVVGAFGVGLAWTLENAERSAPPSAPAAQAEEQVPPAKPRFDFYNILPEMEVVVPDEELTAAPPPVPVKPPRKPEPAAKPPEEKTVAKAPEKKTEPKPSPSNDGASYLLQVASYRSVAEAERLKARLALLGMQSQIQQVTISGKDTYHRVRAGPYRGKESANIARALLTRNGLESIAIKLK